MLFRRRRAVPGRGSCSPPDIGRLERRPAGMCRPFSGTFVMLSERWILLVDSATNTTKMHLVIRKQARRFRLDSLTIIFRERSEAAQSSYTVFIHRLNAYRQCIIHNLAIVD
ncbi:hypothetical protein EVAR_98173_1 [Eumeta japonica]|uniref:Uncharacterized protein n=1 Tax=Eumeta variegata TaxID=151549 RepID=A0A4C1YF74_EUMVA|nr:hypothetical protein EVAR_98173_1 [Eumeta japonica]